MPFQVQGNGNWQRAYTGNIAGAGGACSLVDAGNYPGNIGTIAQNPTWRVDRQNPPAGQTNLQIQKNGVGNPSTIACCLVPNILAQQMGNVNDPVMQRQLTARARFAELTRAIHTGLSRSVGSRRPSPRHRGQMEVQAFLVQGQFSS